MALTGGTPARLAVNGAGMALQKPLLAVDSFVCNVEGVSMFLWNAPALTRLC